MTVLYANEAKLALCLTFQLYYAHWPCDHGEMQAIHNDRSQPKKRNRNSIMDVTASRQIRRIALGILRHTPKTRQHIRNIYWRYRKAQFDKLKKASPTKSNIVLFESFMGRSYSCSPRAIYEAMLSDKRFDGYTLYWSARSGSIEKFENVKALNRAAIVIKGSKEYFEVLASAKYWVTNSRSEEYISPKDDQVYVQCWHGTPLKRLGYDIKVETTNALNTTKELASRYGIEAQKWSCLVSPSPYTTDRLLSCFGLGEQWHGNVLEVGYPRNDDIVNACADEEAACQTKREIMRKLGIESNKKMLLHAPTWRDNDYKAGVGYIQDTLIDFDVLQKTIGDDWVVLFRPHYFIANSFDFSKYADFVINAANVSDINDLYILADALLTDYSSVFFDFANTKRPLLFYWPDFEVYSNEIRGFYFDLKELPGPQCFTSEEVAEAVMQLDKYENRYGTDYAAFRNKFCPLDDGHAAERVIEAVFETSRND